LIPGEGRILGVDLGTVRIGVAISDRQQRVATALTTLARGQDRTEDRRALARVAADEEVVAVIVGLPMSLDGSLGPAARAALDEVSQLGKLLESSGVAVDTVDERFTTVAAYQALRSPASSGKTSPDQGGRQKAGRAGRSRTPGPKARQHVDEVAAALLLQSWLDRRLAVKATAP
jgi:putative Holliday junction resolvase